jgi:surface antigen
MPISKIISSVLAIFLLTACTEGQEKQSIGTIVGAGLGALVGSQVGSGKGQLVGVAVGAIAGGWIGSEVGKGLDEADKLKAQQTAQNALENNKSGQAAVWQNPDSGNSGSYTPISTTQSNGKNCRDFDSTITIDGKTETSKGRACRGSDGTWKIVS